MIEITDTLAIADSEIHLDYTRAPGPGGQNVNKVATAVQLRFDVLNSPSLPDDVRQRLMGIAGARITRDGILILEAHESRSQEQNRQSAMSRLVELVRRAARQPKRRRPTKPTAASKRQRLEAKRRRGEIKRMRRRVHRQEE